MAAGAAQGGPAVVAIQETDDGVAIPVRVIPRAARNAVAGARAGALLVRLTAPPVDGAANAALLRLIGEALGVPARAVRLVSGATSRSKRVEVSGVDVEGARSRLAAAASRGDKGGRPEARR